MATAQDLGPKINTLNRLTALQVLGEKTGAEAIAVPGRAGLDNELIAELIGTTPATVRAALSRVRRKDGGARKSPASKSADGEM
jgi:predicted transcriptional regulator